METFHKVLNPNLCICSQDKRQQKIGELPFLRKAAPGTLTQFMQALASRGLTDGQELSPLKFQGGMFGVVATGVLKVIRYVSDDRYAILDFLTSGDFFLYETTASTGASMFLFPDIIQAATTSCILYMDKTRLDPILQKDQSATQALFEALNTRIRATNERMVGVMTLSAENRIAQLLLHLMRKSSGTQKLSGLIPFNLTRKDLAAATGLSMETASRVLSALEKDGVVRSGRAWITVTDPDYLDSLCRAEVL